MVGGESQLASASPLLRRLRSLRGRRPPGEYDGESAFGYSDIFGLLGEIEGVNEAGVVVDRVRRVEQLEGVGIFGADCLEKGRVLRHILDVRHVLKLVAQAGHLGGATPQ